jgi:hypothetical protein
MRDATRPTHIDSVWLVPPASSVVGDDLARTEWARAWHGLEELGEAFRREDHCPQTNEVWQYMGTHRVDGGVWVHQFRHRHHPLTRKREYRNVACTSGFECAVELAFPFKGDAA